jgi:hypothetical protein
MRESVDADKRESGDADKRRSVYAWMREMSNDQ